MRDYQSVSKDQTMTFFESEDGANKVGLTELNMEESTAREAVEILMREHSNVAHWMGGPVILAGGIDRASMKIEVRMYLPNVKQWVLLPRGNNANSS